MDDTNNFEKAMKYILVNEGGYANVPGDKGGATNHGITRATLSRFRGRPVSVKEVKDLKVDEASDIYWEYYWLPLGLPSVNSNAIAICMFDTGIVRGIGVPPKYAQETCNKLGFDLKIDGVIGKKTLQALNEVDPKAFVHTFASRVEKGFQTIVDKNPTQKKFLQGWLNRAKRLRTLA